MAHTAMHDNAMNTISLFMSVCFLHERRRKTGNVLSGMNKNEKRESLIHRTATTSYPCCGQALGEFRGSWSCMTFPDAKVGKKSAFPKFCLPF